MIMQNRDLGINKPESLFERSPSRRSRLWAKIFLNPREFPVNIHIYLTRESNSLTRLFKFPSFHAPVAIAQIFKSQERQRKMAEGKILKPDQDFSSVLDT